MNAEPINRQISRGMMDAEKRERGKKNKRTWGKDKALKKKYAVDAKDPFRRGQTNVKIPSTKPSAGGSPPRSRRRGRYSNQCRRRARTHEAGVDINMNGDVEAVGVEYSRHRHSHRTRCGRRRRRRDTRCRWRRRELIKGGCDTTSILRVTPTLTAPATPPDRARGDSVLPMAAPAKNRRTRLWFSFHRLPSSFFHRLPFGYFLSSPSTTFGLLSCSSSSSPPSCNGEKPYSCLLYFLLCPFPSFHLPESVRF